MEIIKRNNINIYGKGKQPILFSHGYGCDQNMWRLVAPAFYDNYRVILFDHVGAGKSDNSAYDDIRYSTLEGYANDILEIIDELELNKIIYVGHSVSAMIGVIAATLSPESFDKLVLIGPSPCYINDKDYVGGFERKDIDNLLESLESNFLGWSATMAPIIVGNDDKPHLGQELTESFCRTNPEIAKKFANVTFLSDNREDLEKLSVECLILQCTQDIIAPIEVGYYLNQKIKNSKLVIMKATGHCPNLSAPAETIEAIYNFLQPVFVDE